MRDVVGEMKEQVIHCKKKVRERAKASALVGGTRGPHPIVVRCFRFSVVWPLHIPNVAQSAKSSRDRASIRASDPVSGVSRKRHEPEDFLGSGASRERGVNV